MSKHILQVLSIIITFKKPIIVMACTTKTCQLLSLNTTPELLEAFTVVSKNHTKSKLNPVQI